MKSCLEYMVSELAYCQAKVGRIPNDKVFLELIKLHSEKQIQQVLRTELGGMKEVLADLYIITNQSKYLEAAQRLSHQSILKPLLDKEDKLTGLRANTQIPKVIGFEKIAMLTKNAE